MASYSDRDISLIPSLTFSFVESYIKHNKASSGEKSMDKGFKYFSEGYIHELKVVPDQHGCMVTGKCHKSQRKQEPPHQLKVGFSVDGGETVVRYADYTCPIGISGACGHVTGTLYQLANYNWGKKHYQRMLPAHLCHRHGIYHVDRKYQGKLFKMYSSAATQKQK